MPEVSCKEKLIINVVNKKQLSLAYYVILQFSFIILKETEKIWLVLQNFILS